MSKRVIVTGGAGFIGSALVRCIQKKYDWTILNIDNLTYAGNLASLAGVSMSERYHFARVNICDKEKIAKVVSDFQPDYIIHLAAESHVDRSINGPEAFVSTNVIGTYNMLQSALLVYEKISPEKRETFRFHHVSTDEVYGSLGDIGLFSETTSYKPSSPYSASKAASDHFVRAWHKTYGLPVTISNCSNNYGPYQFPEKLIPLMIINAINGQALPVYGNGKNIRDWLYVDDHVKGILAILSKGIVGETYNIGGSEERTNIDIVTSICRILDRYHPARKQSYMDLISYVPDRPGHDQRYAIDASKIRRELGWVPEMTLATGLENTVKWYLKNMEWWSDILSGSYLEQFAWDHSW